MLPSSMAMATGRIRLRQLKPDDHHLLCRLNNDEGVMAYLDHAPPSPEEVQAQVHRAIDEYSRWPTFGQWIAESPTGEFLGWFALKPRESGETTSPPAVSAAAAAAAVAITELELGYRLRRHAWGRDLATEGSRVLIQSAFRQHPTVVRVVGTTMFVNTASRRVMEKCGMRHIKTFHLEFDDPLPGTELGEVLYEVTRKDWENGLRQAAASTQTEPAYP